VLQAAVQAEKTHMVNLNLLKSLRPVFGSVHLSEITPEQDYLLPPAANDPARAPSFYF